MKVRLPVGNFLKKSNHLFHPDYYIYGCMAYNRNEKSAPSPYVGSSGDWGKTAPPIDGRRKVFSGCMGFFLLVIFFIGLIGWFVWKLLRSEDNYRVQGKAMVATVDGKSYLVSVVSYFQAFSVEKIGGSTIRRGSSQYYLTVNQLPLGQLIAKKKLANSKEPLTPGAIGLLNVTATNLYIMAGKPMRLSLPHLEEKTLLTSVEEKYLPDEYRQYLPDKENNVVWIDLKDGNKAWLNTQNGELNLLPDPLAPPQPSDKDVRVIRQVAGLSSLRFTDLMTPWYLKAADTLYFFASPEIPLKSISSNALSKYGYRENERLKLYKAAYDINQRMGNLVIRESGVQEVSNETFLQSGFLKNELTGEALQPANALLVASRTLTGKDGLLQLTWLDEKTGGIKYRENVTGIDNIKQVIFDPEFLVVIGTEFGTSNADPGRDRIYVAYTKEGALQYFHIHIQ